MTKRKAVIVAILALAAAIVAGSVAMARARTTAELLRADPDHLTAALAKVGHDRGGGIFAAHCAACHGADAKGDRGAGIPDLTDRDFLYGQGRASEIEQIVLHGIRARDSKGWNLASMPAYARARPYRTEEIRPLEPQAIRDLASFLVARTHASADRAAVARGLALYSGRGGCWDCHGTDAKGDSAIGAPDLTDRVWLYGDGSAPAIARSIGEGRAGVCPAFAHRISAGDARAVAIYTASLAGRRT